MILGFIGEAVKQAIVETMPGAIRDALGWHTNVREENTLVTRKIQDGFRTN